MRCLCEALIIFETCQGDVESPSKVLVESALTSKDDSQSSQSSQSDTATSELDTAKLSS